jgi:tetratricopeptide (TPR) repeat protein
LDVLLKRAREYHELKLYEKAVEDYNTAIAKVATIPGLYYNRAVSSIFLGKNEFSIPDLKKALQLDPNFK